MKHPFGRPFGRIELVAACAVVALALALAAPAAFANTTQDGALTVASEGTGTYVCSPAGFGQKSRCYRR